MEHIDAINRQIKQLGAIDHSIIKAYRSALRAKGLHIVKRENNMYERRKINPVKTFDSPMHPLNRRQFHWVETDHGLHVALFAGKEMMICVNDDGKSFQLTYLDMAHPELYSSPEEAKNSAQVFAQSVLSHLMSVVGIPHVDKNDPIYNYL